MQDKCCTDHRGFGATLPVYRLFALRWLPCRMASCAMYGSALNMMAAAVRTFDTAASAEVQLPVALDRVPAMLQFALDSHAVDRSHVMYQSMERWLLSGFGMAGSEPHGHFDNLLNFSVAQHAMFGAAACHFAHGPGATGGSPCSTPADYFNSHNSGCYSATTVDRALPASAKPGPQLPLLLNLFEDIRSDSRAVTYSPCEGCLNTLINLSCDGMSLGKGCMVDEHLMHVTGFEEPIQIAEAKTVLAMDEEQLQVWLAEHPFLADAVEFICTAADNSASGNIGYLFVSSEGNHADVAKRLIGMLRPLRTCYCCLKCEAVRV
jgi:hypothetical protein